MQKFCFKCQTEKPIDEFYKHPEMADGHLNKCKECTKSDVTANRNARLLEARTYDSRRSKQPTRIAATTKSTRRWRQKNHRKYAAQVILNNAIRAGKIKRKPCERCGAKAHAHHENYDKPLEVNWLCATHHSERHKEMRKLALVP